MMLSHNYPLLNYSFADDTCSSANVTRFNPILSLFREVKPPFKTAGNIWRQIDIGDFSIVMTFQRNRAFWYIKKQLQLKVSTWSVSSYGLNHICFTNYELVDFSLDSSSILLVSKSIWWVVESLVH